MAIPIGSRVVTIVQNHDRRGHVRMQMAVNLRDSRLGEHHSSRLSLIKRPEVKGLRLRKRIHIVKDRIHVGKRDGGSNGNHGQIRNELAIDLFDLNGQACGSNHRVAADLPFQVDHYARSLKSDWIIFDAPPSLGLLTINILSASDGVLVPMQCEFYALEGLSQLLKTVDIVRRRINPQLHVAKVLLTMVDNRNKLTQTVAQEVRDYFGDKVATAVIPRNVRLSESPSFGEAAVLRYPTSKGAGAYLEFVDEVLA